MAYEVIALEPFRRDKGPEDYWVSKEVFSTEQLGYTYPDFNGLDPNDHTYVITSQKHILRLYSGPAKITPPRRNPNRMFDWTARIRVKKYELGGSFSVLFFLAPDGVEGHTRSSPSYVGSYSAFVTSTTEACANCQTQADSGIVIQGFVHLNTKIEEIMGPGSGNFEIAVIKPYLTENLKWKVEKVSSLVWLYHHKVYLLTTFIEIF